MVSRQEHFCAFCSLVYKSYVQKTTGPKEFLLCSVFSFILMWTFWGGLHVLGFIFFTGLLALSETLFRVRWRVALRCPHCGFDPVLYKSSPRQAAESVKEFLKRRSNDPSYLLRPNPVLPPFRRPENVSSVSQAVEVEKSAMVRPEESSL